MAFGVHWEWRAFGALDSALRQSLESLPLKFPTSQELTDEYVYVAGCPLNVKLREGDLKLKRFLDAKEGLEQWLEDEDENFPFPLTPERLQALGVELGVEWNAAPDTPWDRERFLRELAATSQEVQVIAVSKERSQMEWRAGASPGTVEVAEVFTPERITSVCFEHDAFDDVRRVVEAFALPGALERLNYLEALQIWARGERIAGPGPDSSAL